MRLLKFFLISISCLKMLFILSPSFADQHNLFNMTRGVTPMSRDIYDLHMIIFWVCVAIGIAVFSMLIYVIIKHRQTRHPIAAKFHSSLKVELLWTIIPFIILIIMAIPATVVLVKMEDASKADINIKVIGYQWKWQYEYLDYGISFFSNLSTPQAQIQSEAKKGKWYLLEVDKPLVVPIHKKIRFLVTSNDVVHSWWVPALGIKRDAIPGFIHAAWARIDKPGIYRGQCAELCGMNHAYMPIVVQAVSQAEFDKWVQSQPKVGQTPTPAASVIPSDATAKETSQLMPSAVAAQSTIVHEKTMTQAELMTEGKKVYERNCSVCHQSNGTGMPPAFPSLVGTPVVNGPIGANIAIVMQGKPGTAMQAFGKQLSIEEIAAVVSYIRNTWKNGDPHHWGKFSGGWVQPEDVLEFQQLSGTKSSIKTSSSPAENTVPKATSIKENL